MVGSSRMALVAQLTKLPDVIESPLANSDRCAARLSRLLISSRSSSHSDCRSSIATASPRSIRASALLRGERRFRILWHDRHAPAGQKCPIAEAQQGSARAAEHDARQTPPKVPRSTTKKRPRRLTVARSKRNVNHECPVNGISMQIV